MKICSKCKTENIFDDAQFCKNCGAPLDEGVKASDQDEDLDFVVTESQAPQSPNFIETRENQASTEAKNNAPQDDEPLDIASTSDILDMGIEDHELVQSVPESKDKPENDFGDDPIFDDYKDESSQKDVPPKIQDETPSSISWEDSENVANKPKAYNPASEDDIRHAQDELRKMANEGQESMPVAPLPTVNENKPDSITPIADPALAEPIKTLTKKRGVAFFKNNSIQLVGSPFLHEGDEIIVNEKPYMLRPKKMDKRMTIGLFAAALIIVLIGIGSQFINSNIGDDGSIIGMVLNEYGQPYLEGAVVVIPELDKKTKSNAQGFFKFEMIPTGTYTIQYKLSENYFGESNATVAGGQTTLMTFDELTEIVNEQPGKKNRQISSSGHTETSENNSTVPTSTASQTALKTSTASNKRGNIKLAANVENARLVLEGQILGSGNMIFTEIRPGDRKVTVDKAGYETYSATITVNPGETTVINASLKKLNSNKKTDLAAKDYIERGNDSY
ncbi:MAG: PEGA domain-containing protein, partial [Candidatus Zixiibacteriota bacterium]